MASRMDHLRNLPALLPDQSLYGWCAMAHAWSGLGSVLETSEILFGNRYAALCHDFPTSLGHLDSATNHVLGDVALLASGRTLLGYFLPFLSPGAAEPILSRVIARSYPSLKMQLGITASRVGGNHPLKACRQCAAEDEAIYGVAYWHISHQPPSVALCPRHACGLWTSTDSRSPVHLRKWLLPFSKGTCRSRFAARCAARSKFVLRLSDFSNRVMKCAPGNFDPEILARSYRSVLVSEGLATESGNLRLERISKRISDRFQALKGITEFRVLASATSTVGLIGSLARATPKAGHPLKHLILIASLFDSWDAFRACYDENREPIQQSPVTEPEEKFDGRRVEFEALARSGSISVSKAARQVGVTPVTGTVWARQVGIDFAARTKSLSEKRTRSAISLLKSGATIAKVSSTCAISESSLRRIVRSQPALEQDRKQRILEARTLRARNAFTRCAKKLPGAPIKVIRAQPGSCYSWLHRHDATWLHQFRSTRV
jgi:hypothetical protein